MKLSLTAIAALFAATLHPSVATGTRAASSNGNTNAAEVKPDRDLELESAVPDLGDLAADLDVAEALSKIGDIGDAYLGGTAMAIKAGVAVGAFSDMLKVQKMTQCLLGAFGVERESAWGISIIGESEIGWFLQNMPEHVGAIVKSLAGSEEWISEERVRSMTWALPEAQRDLFWMAMSDLCLSPLVRIGK